MSLSRTYISPSFLGRLRINLALALSPYTLSKEAVSNLNNTMTVALTFHDLVAVAGSAIKWLRDSMSIIQSAAEINTLAAKEEDTGGVYFVTAFSGLFAPYWDPTATGLMIGISQYTNPSHIARATLEANAFQTKAIIESMKLDSGQDLKNLKVDGGMTNGDLAMSILADIGGFDVVRPEMKECVFVVQSSMKYIDPNAEQVNSFRLGHLCWRSDRLVRLEPY